LGGDWVGVITRSSRNPFALIANVGEDCAGAVQFVRPERLEAVIDSEGGDIAWLEEAEIATRIRQLREDQSAWRLPADTGQFSLAGAQPKTALLLLDGRWGVPSGRTPTIGVHAECRIAACSRDGRGIARRRGRRPAADARKRIDPSHCRSAGRPPERTRSEVCEAVCLGAVRSTNCASAVRSRGGGNTPASTIRRASRRWTGRLRGDFKKRPLPPRSQSDRPRCADGSRPRGDAARSGSDWCEPKRLGMSRSRSVTGWSHGRSVGGEARGC